MCKDCCTETASYMGCEHGICPESEEWKTHYCSEGGHCADESSGIEYDEDEHWTVCGSGCDIRLSPELHTFGEGSITKEATKKAVGVIEFTCTFCDFVKEETIPKLTGEHTHEYSAVVTEPTCLSGGYTTHTCQCGHTYTDMQTSAVKHSYIHKYTESEHWKECEYCHVATEKAAHKLGSWTTVVKAGYTHSGEKQRECNICGYSLKETIPPLTVPADKLVVIIPDYDKYAPSGSSDDSAADPSGGESTPTVSSPAIKELLTKGEENSVPVLPTLSTTENGNIFEGWVNKATGEPVKKGDKLTENIEIEPIWKDCGEGKHTDTNEDNNCDDCGYILMKPTQPEYTTEPADETTADNEQNGEKAPQAKAGVSIWGIILIACFIAVIAICAVVLIIVLRKKK